MAQFSANQQATGGVAPWVGHFAADEYVDHGGSYDDASGHEGWCDEGPFFDDWAGAPADTYFDGDADYLPSDDWAGPSGYREAGSPFRPPLPLHSETEGESSGFGRGGRYSSFTALSAEISPDQRLGPQPRAADGFKGQPKSKGRKARPEPRLTVPKGKSDGGRTQPPVGKGKTSPQPTTPKLTSFLEALQWASSLDVVVMESFIMLLGGEPGSMPVEQFNLMSARSLSPVVRDLTVPDANGIVPRHASLIEKTQLWNALTQIAHLEGGAISFSFASTGMNDEPLAGAPDSQAAATTQLATMDSGAQMALLATTITDALRPDTRGLKRSREPETAKYAGVMYQAEDVGDAEFKMLTKMQHRDLLYRYDAKSSGGIPEEEQTTVTQLSAILGKLQDDENPAPDFSVMGPFGDRAARFVTRNSEVTENGEKKRRRVRGPDCYEMWRPSWRIFRGGLLVLDACPEGPLNAYEKNIAALNARFGEHWTIVAFAEQCNRSEKWSKYRQICESQAQAGLPPKYWGPDRPWGAVIHMAATDRDYWEDMIEKPILFGKDKRGIAERVSQLHRKYLPASAVDGYDTMMLIDDYSAPGPYEHRNRNAGKGAHPWSQGEPRGSSTPPTTETAQGRDDQGRLSSIKVDGVWKEFCYRFNRSPGNTGCAEPCPAGRVHRCEICTSTKHGTNEHDNAKKGLGRKADSKGGKGQKSGKGKKASKGQKASNGQQASSDNDGQSQR